MSPRIAISLGDPTGIGPEIVVRALAARPDTAIIVFGDEGVLARAAAGAGVPAPPPERVRAVTALLPNEALPGQPTDLAGRAQAAYLSAAVDAVLAGEAAALVTAPISKEWIARAGFAFPGHTEYLAARAGVREFAMMLAGPKLRVTVATTHVALREVPTILTIDSVASAIVLTAGALARRFGILEPRVAVAGLNPHAGEAGRFGDEEERLVRPGIAQARARLAAGGISADVTGPHVPDSVFRQAAGGAFDAVVAMYHDQGHIALKLLSGLQAVNISLGLPIVRTSVAHGTAYDIAGKGVADQRSLVEAVRVAVLLAKAQFIDA